MKEPEIVIDVLIDEIYYVESGENSVNMITFHGKLECEAFSGEIMPGAVDTQHKCGENFTLSARYMIRGKDENGNPASVFIENNGSSKTNEAMRTTPKILTDCEGLKYLEDTELYGTIVPVGENHIHIKIFKK